MLRRIAPALVLLILAPFIGEALLGNTPLTSAAGLIFELPMYGGGALFIRELVRRTGRGFPTILFLGAAYGLVEEGLGDLTLWSHTFMGMHLNAYGNMFGIGWPWWLHVLTLHTVWSIGVTVALTEALFARRGTGPWLGKVGLVVSGAVFVLGTAAVHFLGPWNYTLKAWQVAVTVALVAIAVVVAFLLPRRRTAPAGRTAPAPLLVALAGLAAGTLFLAANKVLGQIINVPAGVLVATDVVLFAVSIVLLGGWSRRSGWDARHTLALAAGAAATYAWQGIVMVWGSPVNTAGQVLFILITAGIVALGMRKVRAAMAPADGLAAPLTPAA